MEQTREGVWNLVTQCAEVNEGNSVLILNEFGKVEEEMADLIAEAVKARGAEYHVLWGDTIERGRSDLPQVLVGAFLSADKVISNYGINRAVLDQYIRGRGIVQINNSCRTTAAMNTPHAGMHWGMVRAIYSRLEEMFAAGERWRITTPDGTDISGKIGKESEIADAYFAVEAEAERLIRTYPGAVYSPVGSADAEGRIVTEYINYRDPVPWPEPVTLTVKDSRVMRIEGSEHARRFEADLEANVKAHGDNAAIIDSFHGGIHPKARIPTAKAPSLQEGAQHSTALMHFHVGRILAPISAGVLNHTIEVDGNRLYENGRLTILDDPKIREAAQRYGVEDWGQP